MHIEQKRHYNKQEMIDAYQIVKFDEIQMKNQQIRYLKQQHPALLIQKSIAPENSLASSNTYPPNRQEIIYKSTELIKSSPQKTAKTIERKHQLTHFTMQRRMSSQEKIKTKRIISANNLNERRNEVSDQMRRVEKDPSKDRIEIQEDLSILNQAKTEEKRRQQSDILNEIRRTWKLFSKDSNEPQQICPQQQFDQPQNQLQQLQPRGRQQIHNDIYNQFQEEIVDLNEIQSKTYVTKKKLGDLVVSPFSESLMMKSVQLDERGWFYLDEFQCVQGPFTSIEMDNWFLKGYFTPSLMVGFKNSNRKLFFQLKSLCIIPQVQQNCLDQELQDFLKHEKRNIIKQSLSLPMFSRRTNNNIGVFFNSTESLDETIQISSHRSQRNHSPRHSSSLYPSNSIYRESQIL